MKKNAQVKKRKKMLYEIMCCKEYTPMRAKDLAVLLQIPAGKRDELHKILDMLLEEGKISIKKRGRYEAVRKENGKKQKEPSREQEKKSKGKREFYLTGTFVGNAKGFGFVEVEGEEEDIFISEEHTGDALHKDTVQIRIIKEERDGRRREGAVVKVLER